MDNLDDLLNSLEFSSLNNDLNFNIDDLQKAINRLSCRSGSFMSFDKSDIDSCDIPEITPITLDTFVDIESDFDPIGNAFECKEKLEAFTKDLKKKYDDLIPNMILLEKLKEFRYMFDVIYEYYKVRSDEMVKILSDFQPLLKRIRDGETRLNELKSKRDDISSKLNDSFITLEYKQTLSSQLDDINSQISDLNRSLVSDRRLLNERSKSNSFISNDVIQNLLSSDSSDKAEAFRNQYKSSLDSIGFNNIKASLKSFSDRLDIKTNYTNDNNIKTIIQSPVISFSITLPNLNFVESEFEEIDNESGKTNKVKRRIEIFNNKTFKSNSFFKNNPTCKIYNETLEELSASSDALYGRYYYPLSNPIDNLFTLDERGLTSDANLVDPKLAGTGFSKKRESSGTYYIKDLDKSQYFYSNFKEILDKKKKELFENNVKPYQEKAKSSISILAKMDANFLLSIGRVNVNIAEENKDLSNIIETIKKQNLEFQNKKNDLDSEIERLETLIGYTEKSPDDIQKELSKLSPKCFTGNVEEDPNCDSKDYLGIDPLYDKTLDGVDPTLPNPTQLCYWKEFSKILNIYGLLPIPDSPVQLRYWPVGMVIPGPKLVKIPLPIIWKPLTVISSPFGIIVMFIAINGIFISPVMFMMTSSGIKQHLLTLKGPSKSFGYDPNKVMKDSINVPLGVISRASNESNTDKLSDKEKKRAQDRLKKLREKRQEAESNSDDKRVKRLDRKISDLENALSGKNDYEKLKDANDNLDSITETLEDFRKSLIERIDDLGTPKADKVKRLSKKEIDRQAALRTSMYLALKLNDLDTYNELKSQLEKPAVSKDETLKAIRDDISDFFDNIKLPTITIPKDVSKLNPKPNPIDVSNSSIKETVSNNKNKTLGKTDRKVKTFLLKTVARIDTSMDPIELTEENTELVRSKLIEKITDMMDMILPGGNDSEKHLKKIEEKKKELENEKDPNLIRKIRNEINELGALYAQSSYAELVSSSFSMTPEMLNMMSGFSIDFDPFKKCCKQKPVSIDPKIDIDVKTIADTVKAAMIAYTGAITINELLKYVNGSRFLTGDNIKYILMGIIESSVNGVLSFPEKFKLQDIGKAFSGVLKTLTLPNVSISETVPFSLNRPFVLDFNSFKGTIKSIILRDVDEVIKLMGYDIDNVTSIRPGDLKAIIKYVINYSVYSIESYIKPIYNVINTLSSIKGLNLTAIEKAIFNTSPYGSVLKAKFIVDLFKIKALNRSDMIKIPLLDVLNTNRPLISKVFGNVFSTGVTQLIVASSILAKQKDTIRQLHPVMNADDIPPWERLSIDNPLFLLFLDDFISSAADRLGFFRKFA